MINEEKKKALEAALGHIEKQYGKGSVMKLGESSANMPVSYTHLHYPSSPDRSHGRFPF